MELKCESSGLMGLRIGTHEPFAKKRGPAYAVFECKRLYGLSLPPNVLRAWRAPGYSKRIDNIKTTGQLVCRGGSSARS
jgi:hypothetical protein